MTGERAYIAITLSCRHFRDLAAYRRWEPLLDGEPLEHATWVPQEGHGHATAGPRR